MVLFSPKISVLVCTLLLVGTAAAKAQTARPKDDACSRDPACQRHYVEARTFSKAGQLGEALDEYRKAYAIQPVPTLLYNIARLNHKLGRLQEAANTYKEYLQRVASSDEPNPELQTKAGEYLAQIQSESPPEPPPSAPPAPKNSPREPSLQAISLTPSAPPADVKQRTPVYKRPWFWVVIGAGSAVVVAGVVTGVVLGTRASNTPDFPDHVLIQRWSLRSQP